MAGEITEKNQHLEEFLQGFLSSFFQKYGINPWKFTWKNSCRNERSARVTARQKISRKLEMVE